MINISMTELHRIESEMCAKHDDERTNVLNALNAGLITSAEYDETIADCTSRIRGVSAMVDALYNREMKGKDLFAEAFGKPEN